MNKRTLHILLLICLVFVSKSQTKIFNNWVFGNNAGLTFNTNPPSFIQNCQLTSIEACGSISDDSGNILFYSDGVTVFNKNNIQMSNGFGLNGNQSSTQGAIIVPNPSQSNIYYLFYMDREDGYFGGCACLSYAIIDLNLQGGLGDVISKNNILYNHVTEKIAVTKQPSDTSYWLVAHEYGSNNFLSYSINPNGVNLTPVISSIGDVICCDITNFNVIGQMKISPDLNKLGLCSSKDGIVQLFDFNNSTGVISNPIAIAIFPKYIYGFEFSANSNLMYITHAQVGNNYIWQYDVSIWDSLSISSSKQEIYFANTHLFGQLQLGPDSKIYVAMYDEQNFSVINNPDMQGWQCNFQLNTINLFIGSDYGLSKLGLPNRIIYPVKRETPKDTICKNIIIPNVLTPNNDGVNDRFRVQCDTQYIEPSDLIIYNRWGQEIYNLQQNNNFNTLSDGTYFYVFSIYDKKYKGFLSIFK